MFQKKEKLRGRQKKKVFKSILRRKNQDSCKVYNFCLIWIIYENLSLDPKSILSKHLSTLETSHYLHLFQIASTPPYFLVIPDARIQRSKDESVWFLSRPFPSIVDTAVLLVLTALLFLWENSGCCIVCSNIIE